MFDLQGHRGARGLFPENTMEGFRAALALGVHSFEIDTAVTRDGVVVLSHDPALNPDLTRQDGAWLPGIGPLIRDLTYADLSAYDVGRVRPGSATAKAFPDQRPHDGARIPTLAQALALDARFNIELKTLPTHPEWTVPASQMAELVWNDVRAAGAADRVTVQSFDWRGPRHLRGRAPNLGWLTRPETVANPALWWGRDAAATVAGAVAEEGGAAWTPEHKSVTQADCDAAHALGLKVIPWTVNDTATMQRLIGWGVDGLITDRPDLALPLPHATAARV